MLPLKIRDIYLDTSVKEVSQLQDYVAERLAADRDDWLYEVMLLWQLITTDNIPKDMKPRKWRKTVIPNFRGYYVHADVDWYPQELGFHEKDL